METQRIDRGQFWTMVGTNIGIAAILLSLIVSMRMESRNDYRHHDTVINEIRGEIAAINKEMSDFHTKLAIQDVEFKAAMLRIEERYQRDKHSETPLAPVSTEKTYGFSY